MGSFLGQPDRGRARSRRSQHGQSFQRPRTLSKCLLPLLYGCVSRHCNGQMHVWDMGMHSACPSL